MVGRINITKNKGTGVMAVINQNNSLIIMSVCVIMGIMAGVLFFKAQNTSGTYYSEKFAEIYTGLKSGFWSVLKSSVLEMLPFIAGVFLAGTCMVGTALVPAILILWGGSLGIFMAYTYCNLGLMGIIFNLLIIIPGAVISSVTFVLTSREAVGFSISLARLALPEINKPAIDKDFKIYCLRQLFVLIFFLAAAIVKAIMTVSFIGFFKF